MNNRKQLEQYLKSHPGNPPLSEFDWGTGETPRRSVRLSEKAKAAPPPEIEPLKKRGRKASALKPDKKEAEVVPQEADGKKDVELQDAVTAESKKENNAENQFESGSENKQAEDGKNSSNIKEESAGKDDNNLAAEAQGEQRNQKPDAVGVMTENKPEKGISGDDLF